VKQLNDTGRRKHVVFWRRKRSEGFEWRDYVRTTILVRREQRKQRLKDVQAAAAEQVKDAGKRGVEAGKAGARKAGAGLESGLRAGSSAIATGATSFADWTASAFARASHAIGNGTIAAIGAVGTGLSVLARGVSGPLGPILEPVLDRVRDPRINLALKIVAGVTGFGAAYRTWTFGFDGDAMFAAILCAITAILLVLAYLTDERRTEASSERDSLLARLRGHEFELPGNRQLNASHVGLAVLGVAALLAAGSALYRYGSPISFADSSPSAPVTTGALPETDPSHLEGRATALTGDSLRVAGTDVVLDGIEAPEASQSCKRANGGAWRCGAAAKETLAGLIRGKRINCEILGEGDVAKRARCHLGEKDLAEVLVRQGHVFAHGGFWSTYAGVQDEAQTEKLGLWDGEAERPQEFRDKRWQEAKEKAPDGCPIKGPIRSGARTYVLPWSLSYDSIKLRTSRGERWFCSESEAAEAGWKRGRS
jgi:endonuclease YncB( thermonuclease family)